MNSYTLTRESANVVLDGKVTTVKRGNPNFLALRAALLAEQWDKVRDNLTVGVSIARWAKGRFAVVNGVVEYDSQALPSNLNGRIMEMASNGEDPGALFKFWENLQLNPSKRSVDQLWDFLEHLGIPLTSDGHFLAYKGVRTDFLDCHSGTIDNSPGRTIRMNRNQISDDPEKPCHEGLHVGALEYASSFGPNVVIAKVNPANVVCIPKDSSFQKMRVCEYTVIGLYNGQGHLPSTTIPDEDIPTIEASLPSRYRKFVGASESDLLEETTETLRDLAANGLGIVGASRILGGKGPLVKAILGAAKKLA